MACAYCHDFEKTSYSTRSRTSLFSVMIFYFLFPTNDSGENSFFFFFFSDTITCVGHFAASQDQVQGHSAFVPFLSTALLLYHLCLWRILRMKLASEERVDLWRDCRETYPQNTLRAAGSPGCPSLGHCRGGPNVGVLPPTSLWPACPSQLVLSAVEGYWLWPASVHREQQTGYGTLCQINDISTDVVALGGVWGEAHAITKPYHVPHHTCVQRDTQTGNADASRRANFPHPPSPIYSCLKWKGASLQKPRKYINIPKTLTQTTLHPNRCFPASPVGEHCRLVQVLVLLACRRNLSWVCSMQLSDFIRNACYYFIPSFWNI